MGRNPCYVKQLKFNNGISADIEKKRKSILTNQCKFGDVKENPSRGYGQLTTCHGIRASSIALYVHIIILSMSNKNVLCNRSSIKMYVQTRNQYGLPGVMDSNCCF